MAVLRFAMPWKRPVSLNGAIFRFGLHDEQNMLLRPKSSGRNWRGAAWCSDDLVNAED